MTKLTELSVRVGSMAACCLLLTSTPSWAQIEAVFNVPVVITEGVVAHPDGTVYFTDLRGDRILQLGTNGLITTYRQPANNPNGLRLDAQFRLLAAESTRITRTDLETGRIEVLADNTGAVDFGRPNDLTFDASGRIYFTGSGEVYRLDTDGTVTKIAASPLVQGSNGLILSLDDRTLYLVEINRGEGLPRRIRAFDLSPEGTLSNPQVCHDFAPGRGGDGMGIDVDGNVYVAAGMNQPRGTSETLQNQSAIYVLSPECELINQIPIPQDTMTNLGFGGPDMKTMYVTSGNSVFRVAMGIAGTRR